MSLILPPSSTFARRSGGFGAKGAYLKVFGAFLAGAVIAGAAIKGPNDAASNGDSSAQKPGQAAHGDAAKTRLAAKGAAPAAADAKQKRVAAKPQTSGEDHAAQPSVNQPAQAAGAVPSAAASEAAAAPVDETVTLPGLSQVPAVQAARSAVPLPPVVTRVASTPSQLAPEARPALEARPQAEAARPAVEPRAVARAVREQAPVVAMGEPAAEAVAPARRPRLALKKPARPAHARSARARSPRRVFDRDRPRMDPSGERYDDLQARNESEGFSLVRSRVLPDGRRVSVYRRYDEAPARVLAYVDDYRPMPRFPFGFLGIR